MFFSPTRPEGPSTLARILEMHTISLKSYIERFESDQRITETEQLQMTIMDVGRLRMCMHSTCVTCDFYRYRTQGNITYTVI